MKIVIVDDSELLRDRVKELISDIKEADLVGEAKNGIEAIKIIKEKKPDFVLLDIRMPEVNGIEVLKEIKGSGSSAKVCIFSNYPYLQYKKRCMEEGADYFFDKNVDILELKDLIKRLAQK